MSTRFVILSQPRTGSTLLNAALRQHPQVLKHSEILNHGQRHSLPWDGYQRLTMALRPIARYKAVGCTMHAFQPDRGWPDYHKWEPAWDALEEDPSIKIIRLQRLNALAQLASWKIADVLGMWGDQSDVTERPSVRIEPYELFWFRSWNQMTFDRRLSRLGQHTILEVTYEDLCDDWDQTVDRIQRYIGVDPLPISQPFPKWETRPLDQVVSNYEELQAGMKQMKRWREVDT
jgi:hypothetical protein